MDFAGNGGRLAGNPVSRLGWYAVAGAAVGGLSVVVHPTRLGIAAWMRIAALLLIPIASGLALAAWDAGRGRIGDGRGRAAFWAGLAFGAGYVLVRLVVAWTVRW